MSSYEQLKKLFHKGNINIEQEYSARFNSYATYRTDIYLKAISKGVFSKEENQLFLFNSKSLMKLNEQIIENSKKIQILQSKLPSIALEKFTNKLLINELQSTNEIESVTSTKRELGEAINNINNEVQYKRFLGLVKLYKKINREFKLEKLEDIRTIYDELLLGEIVEENNLDGELFRKNEVNIDSSGKIIHKGVSPEEKIKELLAQIINFINVTSMPDIYKYMVFHYVFEYIHPFYDGNGRVGRYLVCNYLAKKLDFMSAITFSYSINRNKSKYYKSFEDTSHPLNKGELTFFVENMLSFIVDGQNSILSYLEENISILKKLLKNIEENLTQEKEQNIFFLLAQSYLFSAKDNQITILEISEVLKYDRKTIVNYILKNEDKVEKIKSKPAIYALKDSYVYSIIENY